MGRLDLPFPPLEMANRVGSLATADDPFAYYSQVGRRSREDIEAVLPAAWSFADKRVLDFGCGAGRTLRHFATEADAGEFWGCDIDAASVGWMQEQLRPPFHVFQNGESPPLEQPDGYFDLIWCISVFTHLVDTWSAWLLELRRVLAPDGLLVVTFMGEGMSELILGEPWDEKAVGMGVRRLGQSWDLGGPMVLHSPWWIREHWGRAFEIVELRPHGFAADPPLGQGTVVLRSNGNDVTAEQLEHVDLADPREAAALAHNARAMAGEILTLRQDVDHLTACLATRQEELETLQAAHAAVVGSVSWRATEPLRSAKRRLAARRARRGRSS